MKKQTLFTYFAGAAICASALVSCQKEAAQNEELTNTSAPTETVAPSSGKTVLFSAGIETKTYIGAPEASGNYRPRWHSTDHIIVNGVQSSDLTLKDSGHSAEFTVDDVTASYYAVTPVSAYNAYSAGNNTISILVRGTGNPQTYTATGEGGIYPCYDRDCGIFAAYSEDEFITFKPVMCWYKLSFEGSTDEDNIQSVYIRQAGENQNIAGLWTISFSGGVPTMTPTTLSAIIALNCGNEGVSQSKPLMIGVPAYDYADGLIITVKDVNGHFISKTIPASETALAAKAGNIITKTLAFSPKSGTINNAADWNAFATAVNSANDWDLYRWVGNGTVKVKSFTADVALTQVTGKNSHFSFNVDGTNGGGTGVNAVITRNSTYGSIEQKPLFRNVYGTVSNLTLAGDDLTVNNQSTYASFADTLYAGGTIYGCSNTRNIIHSRLSSTVGCITGGIVAEMAGGRVEACTNSGNLTSTINCTSGDVYNLQLGGIVGRMDNATLSPTEDALLKDCRNEGDLLAIPVNSNASGHAYGVQLTGVGGIVGWLRGKSYAFTLDNCDNEGAITYSGESITSPDGTKPYQISVGGIIGLAGDISSTYGVFSSNVGADGLDVTLSGCDNSGNIRNCGINYSMTTGANNKVYTGGIAGSLVGTSAKKASLSNCSNTGTLLTYDLCGSGTSTRPAYCQIVGGLIGYGAYLDIDACSVNCVIGNGKRAASAVAGAIGLAMRPFEITGSSIWFSGLWTRISAYNLNSATAAVVCKVTDFAPMPDVNGSSITNSQLGGRILYNQISSPTSTADNSANCTSTITLTASSSGNPTIVRGVNYSAGDTIRGDVTLSGNTTLNAAPSN